MSGHCNECGNTQCVCAANDPAWRIFKKRGEIARLEARVAELERAMESVHVSLLMAADKTCDQPAWLDHATSTAKAVLPNRRKGGTE